MMTTTRWTRVAFLGFACALGSSCKSQSIPAPDSTPHDASPVEAAAPTQTDRPMPNGPSSPGSADSLANVARGDRDFAARLYGKLRAAPGNLFFSPTSIRVALGMAFAGAAGETRAEMARTLSLGDDASDGFAALLTDWSSRGHEPPKDAKDWERSEAERSRLVLRVVNRLWGQKGKTFQPGFLKTLGDKFAAPLDQLDFQSSPDPSRLTINQWVDDQTEHRIKDLLAPGSVNSATRLVLTNAVYFKATWREELGPASPGDFFVTPGQAVKTPMMHLERHMSLATAEIGGQKAKIVVIPYAAPGVAMVAFVPDAKDGLSSLEAGLDGKTLEMAMGSLPSPKVDLSMPKWKTTSAFGLADTLTALGMPSAFVQGKADFSGMDGTKELFIGAVVHKAFVAVDEKGTEAAAATAVAMAGAGAPLPEPVIPVSLDHPFAYAIVDTKQHVVLFMGRVVDPR